MDEINKSFPVEKKTNTENKKEEIEIDNNDSWIEPPCLCFHLFQYHGFWDCSYCRNDISIKVVNSHVVNGFDIGNNPPSSYQDYKNVVV